LSKLLKVETTPITSIAISPVKMSIGCKSLTNLCSEMIFLQGKPVFYIFLPSTPPYWQIILRFCWQLTGYILSGWFQTRTCKVWTWKTVNISYIMKWWPSCLQCKCEWWSATRIQKSRLGLQHFYYGIASRPFPIFSIIMVWYLN
jgi:hypothetical protein